MWESHLWPSQGKVQLKVLRKYLPWALGYFNINFGKFLGRQLTSSVENTYFYSGRGWGRWPPAGLG